MVTSTTENIVDFLLAGKEQILNEWKDNILITTDDPFKDRMEENGEVLFYLVLQSLTVKTDKLEGIIRNFSISIADQRVKAGGNIGEFVYNVNLGRRIIQNYIKGMNTSLQQLQFYLEQIHYCLDQYLYYSVTCYSDVKNQIIEEKTKFIDTSHKDRLTLLGQMTSSFIHEFRNPLTSIQGFIQLLKSENPQMKYLDIISIELQQLNFRISQFLLLSKKELIGKEKLTFSLNELIEEVLVFLYPSILDGQVKIVKDIEETIFLHGYADEIRQVLINIIFNAIDVLNTSTRNPLIEIKLKSCTNGKITLEIANNGPMIPPHLINTIFEPFVTTKKLGTGLGLFVCREIIEKHKGNLDCTTREKLTVFSISLPIAHTQ
ncbi:signal transduction histidine kinase [Cytobacillus eiseniae]|uniref:histidine kinase n=1 Tax=Cytobacillus eiseniae TaxID=762947 RepID=A0ABS4RDR0_9BACI|nr:histidine kinase N-terminal domain-containing protein [Cytobacillus eiseniae]MBP2241040.1 signal transduction histidine kinase [Cytobacillus eiseniae]